MFFSQRSFSNVWGKTIIIKGTERGNEISHALRQVDNIVSLLEENEWRNYLYNHLSPVRYELERQLTNLKEKQSNGKEVQD